MSHCGFTCAVENKTHEQQLDLVPGCDGQDVMAPKSRRILPVLLRADDPCRYRFASARIGNKIYVAGRHLRRRPARL